MAPTRKVKSKVKPSARKARPEPKAGKTRTASAAKATPAARSAAAGKKKPPGRLVAAADVMRADPTLFEPLTAGERADALRILLEDRRVAAMAKVGRYRVVAVEPLVLKPPDPLAGQRLAHLVIYDYAADVSVDGCVDLDHGLVSYVSMSTTQPMLAPEEEAAAIAIASADDRVKAQLSLGDEPMTALQYWSRHAPDLAYRRRSAAVVFGQPGARPTAVAVVDLVDNVVAEVVPAEQW